MIYFSLPLYDLEKVSRSNLETLDLVPIGETWERAFVTQNKWRLALNKREGVEKAYVAQGGILVLLGFCLMTCFNLVSQTKSNQN